MKKAIKSVLWAMISTSMAASALAQGWVQFENAAGTGNIYLGSPGSLAPPGTYTVALLWADSSSLVPQSQLTQIATYNPTAAAGDGPGYFYGPTVTTPSGSGTMAFEVQGWTGNFANYAAAIAGGAAFVGQSIEFLNNTTTLHPPVPPPNLSGAGGNWDGNLYMFVPEPGTLALGGLGAATLLFFRRRK